MARRQSFGNNQRDAGMRVNSSRPPRDWTSVRKKPGWDEQVGVAREICIVTQDAGWLRNNDVTKSLEKMNPTMPVGMAPDLWLVTTGCREKYCK